LSNNVLEHLTDPVQTLRFLAGLLRDGQSKMAHATPCYRYSFEFTRFHLFFFAGRSLARVAARAGLAVRETWHDDIRVFTRLAPGADAAAAAAVAPWTPT